MHADESGCRWASAGGLVGHRVQRECPVCGRSYAADSIRLAHGRQTTCSRECSYVLRARRRSTSRAYECAVCGKRVLRSPSQVKSIVVFCSSSCHCQGRSLGLLVRTVRRPYRVSDAGREAWREAGRRRKGRLRKESVEWECEARGYGPVPEAFVGSRGCSTVGTLGHAGTEGRSMAVGRTARHTILAIRAGRSGQRPRPAS